MTKLKVLVAGGAGYIGGTTTRLLEESGHDVTVFDNLSTGHRDNVLNSKLIEGDILDPKDLKSLFDNHKFDLVMDFAAKIQVEESTQQPELYFHNNTFGPIKLIEASAKAGVGNFILSSTAAVYGNPITNPIQETDQVAPINPYGWSKLMAELALKSFEQSHGLSWLAFRYFNAAGAYQGIGPDYPFMTHLIPSAIKALLEKRQLQVFGHDYPTPDGSCVRDFIHVYDVARAHLLAAEQMVEGKNFNRVINLGSNKGFSVLQVIEAIENRAKQKVSYKLVNRRPGDPAQLIASNELAKGLLDWKPKYDLDQIVADTFIWQTSE